MLAAIYGDCRINQSFPWPAHPAQYTNTPLGEPLAKISAALGDFRGHRDFIKSAEMPPCDYFVPDPPFILEFDESQHFSGARLITLCTYPAELKLGYSLAQWCDLCHQIDARDDQPFDRDERRAWYDMLRDMLPIVHGFQPTVRLYAGALPWCALDSRSAVDQSFFRHLVQGRKRHKSR